MAGYFRKTEISKNIIIALTVGKGLLGKGRYMKNDRMLKY